VTGDKGHSGDAAPGRKVAVIAGPTASGKSALALAVARALGGTVVNADSMQVYRDLAILTARPDAAAHDAAPHRLYGVLDGAELCSAARWRDLALAEIDRALAAGRLPILVGGTGLYLEALLRGIAPIPPVPEAIRAGARALLAQEGAAALHARLAAVDPEAAATLMPTDSQRLARAWEVWRATGRSIRAWQRDTPAPTLRRAAFLLSPPREILDAAIGRRFAAMIEAGALGEVERLLARRLDPALPILKAVGVREIAEHLAGRTSRAAMLEAGRHATRRYAKRQGTWFRHRLKDAVVIQEQYSERIAAEIIQKIKDSLLT
jgi:tRNA dimethylallyltransferase